jgi:penicillin-binding protein 1A
MNERQRIGPGRARPPDAEVERRRERFALLQVGNRLVAFLPATRRRRIALLSAALAPLALLLFMGSWLIHHVYFDRDDLPDLAAFYRFEPPTIGVVRDRHGAVMIELAREYRRLVSYDEVPVVLRQALLAAEDRRFFTHSGVDYRVLPRVIQKSVVRTWRQWRTGGQGLQLMLPQGGSTLTQQLVRGYFLGYLTSRVDRDGIFHSGLAPPRLLAEVVGAPATNKLLRKLEEVRLTLWLEREMVKQFGTRERAKQEIFARYANFIYLGSGRYGFAAASEYYFGKLLSSLGPDDAGEAALLAAIGKSPKNYAPAPTNQRLLARRNQILALMARNEYITEAVARRCQREPIRLAVRGPIRTEAPAVIGHVLDEVTRHGGGRFGVEDLFQGRIAVESTVDARVQTIVNEALEQGLALYEERHPRARGLIQGSVVVLRNADAAILAEVGGRQAYGERDARYSDLNRATSSLRQPGSAMKPLVYMAAFLAGMDLDSEVPDEPIAVPTAVEGEVKWIANYDRQFKGLIPMRQALAESRNAAAIWLTRKIGVDRVIRTANELGIRTPLQPYLSTALGASEVRLVELANAYRAIASGMLAQPHVVARVTGVAGERLYEAPTGGRAIRSPALRSIQEGLRGVVRIPGGTAHRLAASDFPIAVMGKTGTTNEYRDALFVGSTYGKSGITVAVRIGFDDNRPLGGRETGSRAALPIFREVVLRVYADGLVGPAPEFPREVEAGIDQYLVLLAMQPTVEPRVSDQEASDLDEYLVGAEIAGSGGQPELP